VEQKVGEWWIDPQLTISTGSQPVTIESIDLQTSKGVYPANIKNQSKIIPALSNHEILSVSWEFSRNTPASEIMGDSGRLLFHLKVVIEDKTAEIEYRRSKCC
jgi:subtilase family serine protease